MTSDIRVGRGGPRQPPKWDIKVGHLVTEINSVNISLMGDSQITNILKKTGDSVVLTIGGMCNIFGNVCIRERPLMTSNIRVGRGVQDNPENWTLQGRTKMAKKRRTSLVDVPYP